MKQIHPPSPDAGQHQPSRQAEGEDVKVVGQLLHRAYGKTYVVNIERESPIPAG